MEMIMRRWVVRTRQLLRLGRDGFRGFGGAFGEEIAADSPSICDQLAHLSVGEDETEEGAQVV
jgi:hypothetical protein